MPQANRRQSQKRLTALYLKKRAELRRYALRPLKVKAGAKPPQQSLQETLSAL